MTTQYYDALTACLDRYRVMLETDTLSSEYSGHEDLLDFIDEFESAIEKRYPLNKLNRWLGYIQGVMIERGLTTVPAERDWTRPLFRPIDFAKKKISLGAAFTIVVCIILGMFVLERFWS